MHEIAAVAPIISARQVRHCREVVLSRGVTPRQHASQEFLDKRAQHEQAQPKSQDGEWISVEGLPVYGAYAKAAFDRSGALVHLIDQLAAAPTTALPQARVGAEQALRAALAQLHPGAPADFGITGSQGTVTTFAGVGPPSVRRVGRA